MYTMKQTFSEEKKEIEERIWRIIDIQHRTKTLDIGVGENATSTKRLIELDVQVTAVDKKLNSLSSKEGIKAQMVCADASLLPFQNKVFDLSLAFFTMHEVQKNLHRSVFSELVRTSHRIVIVEPNPGKDELYRRYWHIMNRAGKSIGECEEYQEMDYWIEYLRKHSADISVKERIPHKTTLRGSEAVEYFQRASEGLRKYGITSHFIEEVKKLAEDAKQKGMLFSDISVIIAQCL
jgi:ubiquinone/menaquinone biosynthesis C-methylase UbiE